MKMIILVSLLASLAMSQIVSCVVCAKIPNCPKELFSDSYVDTIFDFIISQTKLNDFPQEVAKVVSDSQTNYSFVWPVQTYVATIDHSTHKFKVIAIPTVQKLNGGYSTSRISTYNTQATVQNTQTTSEIMSHIDNDIRKKYFAGQTVSCTEYKTTAEGYHIVYQKLDKTLTAFDVQVKNNGGKTIITYQPSSTSGSVSNVQTNTVTTMKTGSGSKTNINNQNQGTDNTIFVSTTSTVGGYQVISSPSTNSQVIEVIEFLTQQFGSIIKNGVILGAAQQIVSGKNYQLNISIDTSSSAYYSFIVYRSLSNNFSLTSAKLLNVDSTYSFKQALTSAQISQISYFVGLQKAVVQQLSLSSINQVTLDQVFENYPYFQFVFHNAQWSSIVIVVKYDFLASSLIVINKNMVPYTTKNPSTCQQTIPPKQTPQKDPLPPVTPVACKICTDPLPIPKNNAKGNIQSNNQIFVETQPNKLTVGSNNVYTNKVNVVQPPKSRGNLNAQDDYQLVSSDFLSQNYIQSYIKYLSTVDSCYIRQNFIGLYWQINDHNSLNFRFKLSNGNVQQIKVSCDYVQYTLKNPKVNKANKIPNCLKQVGDVCVNCAFKYYLDQGKCSSVPLECSRFNYAQKVCQACYQGYYLNSNNVCILANYLCQSSDQLGNCLTCYRNYRLTAGNRCAFIANGTDYSLPKQQENPLCAAFNGLTCLKCVQACYLNPAGICKIPDPNCQTFDQVKEQCKVCMESYVLSPTSKRCLAEKNY